MESSLFQLILKMYKKCSIEILLWTSFIPIVLILLSVATTGISIRNEIIESYHTILKNNLVRIQLLNSLSKSAYVLSQTTRNIILLNDFADLKKQETNLLAAIENYHKTWNTLVTSYPPFTEDEVVVQNILTAKNAVFLENNKALELARKNKDVEAANILFSSVDPLMVIWQQSIDEYITIQESYNEKQFAATSALSSKFHKYLVVLAVLICPLLIIIFNLFAIKYFRARSKKPSV